MSEATLEWKELSIHTTHEAMEAISELLNRHGANGVLIKDSRDLTEKKSARFGEIYELDEKRFPTKGVLIKAYFLHDHQFPQILESITGDLRQLSKYGLDYGSGEVSVSDIAEADWESAWKKYYKPTHITENITILPSWETYERKHDNERIVILDPGMAFGTGTHETTKLSLQALETYIKTNDQVIDVGCGSGILSITSILLGAKHVYAYDLDNVAINSTKINSALNKMEEKMTIAQNDLLKGINLQADLIVSNILADILVDLMADAYRCLVDDGYFILSGIIDNKESFIKEKLHRHGFQIVERNEEGHWISFVTKKK